LITVAAFILASATFKPNATMPMSTVYKRCGGANVSPELHWQGAPTGTKSFAIVAHDPDAPAPGGWYHWIVYNLPASTHELRAGAALADSQLGQTSFDENAYGGPCPPPGKPHHYVFTIYALDVPHVTGAHLTGPQLEAAIEKHTLAKTTLTGLYQTH
jgi:Raf kinase inhibitor-like YbhB/YbcL family protein